MTTSHQSLANGSEITHQNLFTVKLDSALFATLGSRMLFLERVGRQPHPGRKASLLKMLDPLMAAKKTKARSTPKARAVSEAEISRKIWLAGVGAYGRAFGETKNRLEKISDVASEAFDQLVTRGEVIESAIKEEIEKNQPVQIIAGAVGKLQAFREDRQAELRARLESVRKTVSTKGAALNPLAYFSTIQQLNARIAELTAEIATLKQVRRAQPARRRKQA